MLGNEIGEQFAAWESKGFVLDRSHRVNHKGN